MLKDFWKHKVHYILIGCCVGLALIANHAFVTLLAVVAYVVGLINIPGSTWFKRIVALEKQKIEDAEKEEAREKFLEKQRGQYESLSSECQTEYDNVVGICERIENGIRNVSGADTLLGQLDHMMYTFLKLLVTKVAIQRFLDSESADVSRLVKQARSEVEAVQKQIDGMDEKSPERPFKQRLLSSKQDRLSAIEQREKRIHSARNNLEIVKAEQEKIVAQLELMHADSIAGRGVDSLSEKLSSSFNFLDQTNQWLSEIDEYEYATEEIPNVRVGYNLGSGERRQRERQRATY